MRAGSHATVPAAAAPACHAVGRCQQPLPYLFELPSLRVLHGPNRDCIGHQLRHQRPGDRTTPR